MTIGVVRRINWIAAAVLGIAVAGTPGAFAADQAKPKGQAVEARLQRLEDVDSIRAMLERYIELNESRNYQEYSQLFAKDGELVMRRGRATGPQNIKEMLDKSFGSTIAPNDPLKGSSHVLSNIKISVEGDTATASSRWTLLTKGEDNKPRLGGTGRYGDKLVRENGVWKFKQRIIYRDIPGDNDQAK